MATNADLNIDQRIEKRQPINPQSRRRKILANASNRLNFILGGEKPSTACDHITQPAGKSHSSADVASKATDLLQQDKLNQSQNEIPNLTQDNNGTGNVSHDTVTKESPSSIHDQWLEMKRKSSASFALPWTGLIHVCLIVGTACLVALVKLHYFDNFLQHYLDKPIILPFLVLTFLLVLMDYVASFVHYIKTNRPDIEGAPSSKVIATNGRPL
ncbi:uncharacterized protein TRIADDRAFT_60767 [Trichoplax adhaerens]|uniref:Uncharacterized protein n=1 Tax=Trichoplax adhaerens TaxID=10228 RepID=B3S8W5_TRIAD|nr:predicted protein [Trichoplax adhaerens]EDV20772.1 predicted protein [Trichoplax adhaerens]|eukprot:XP_002116713.1 predicted protein [Trichoplax adhaerens]